MISLRIITHLACVLPLAWLVWAIPEGRLGGDPIKELIHYLGIGALRLLLLTLCISPAAKFFKLGKLLQLRRSIGLWCWAWSSLHFFTWLAFDLGLDWPLILEELVTRTYIVLGFLAWTITSALAVTSIPKLMKRMSRQWKKLHSLIYLTALLACIHFWWSLKSGWIEPAAYLLITFALLYLRKNKLLILFK